MSEVKLYATHTGLVWNDTGQDYEILYRPATTAEIMEAYYDIRNAESPVIWMPKVEIEQDVDDGLYWLRVNDSPFIYFTNKEQAERMKNLLIEQLISYKAEP